MRATSCALGWVRALHQLGILQKARYMCTNSGGSWMNLCMSYQKAVPLEVFLGRYIPPEQLTVQAAQSTIEGSYGETVVDADYVIGNYARGIICDLVTSPDVLPDECVEDWRKVRSWERAVGRAFFSSFELSDLDVAVGLAGRTGNAEATGVPGVYTACEKSSMPFPVQVASIVAPNVRNLFYSFEFTPLYAGVPAYIDDGENRLGNVLVETFAVCSEAPDPDQLGPETGDRETVPLHIKWIPPLSQVAGISSAFIAQDYASASLNNLWDLMGCPEMANWNAIDFTGEVYPFADGGGTDNLGIYPALRRKVQKLFIGVSTGAAPDENFAKDFYDVSGYFGAAPADVTFSTAMGNMDAGIWNSACQVFEKHKFKELLDGLLQKKAAGEPLAVRQQLHVMPNLLQGVTEGYNAEVLWMVNGGHPKWLEQVPQETRDLIEEKCPQFPYFSVMQIDYDIEEVVCLSNLAAWNIFQVRDTLKAFAAG